MQGLEQCDRPCDDIDVELIFVPLFLALVQRLFV